MRFDPQAGVTKTSSGRCRRRFGRLEQEAVESDHGHVLDLSGSGMRIQCRRVPREEFVTRVRAEGIELAIRARVAWTKRIGLFKVEVGVEFIDLTPEMSKKLTLIAMNNRPRRAM